MMTFTVYGIAQPKGSMRAFTPRGSRRPIVTDGNRNVRAWQRLIAAGASDAIARRPAALASGPIRVAVFFRLPRPKKYARRPTVIAHTTRPDADKLARAVLDALTGIAFRDDAQVVELVARKDYAAIDAPASCEISITPLPAFEVAP